MKANELRIGNWLYLPSKGKHYQILSGHDIEEIEDSGDASPIPVTSAWLDDFGFVCTVLNFRYERAQFMIEMWFSDEYYFRVKTSDSESISVAQFEYVHQLQNLYFALTGEELQLTTQQQPNNTATDS